MKKSEKKDCYCALCRSHRVLRYSRHLKPRHYGQILIIGLALALAVYPWLNLKGALALPLIWALFETIHKSLYRKDLRCPYCGFDPTWYKKDVKLARRKVEEFLKQNPESPILKAARKREEILHRNEF